MAEIVVTAVVGVLIEKLISGELIKFARSEGIDSQLITWKKRLPLIQAVLADAGQKEITQKAVQLWLTELQDLVYDIDDVIDDIATEVMKRKLNQEESHANTSTTSKVMKIIIPACCTNNFTPHNFMYGREISSKLDEITARLHDLLQQKKDLGLNVNVKVERSNKTDVRSQQTSSVSESKVLGRQEDKEALIGQLLENAEARGNQNVMSIVSIVGMGGLGKTTLAQLLYNDHRVKDHFELMAWVCVSDEFDVFSISKQIYQAVGGENKEFTNLDLLHVALKEKLSNKRFLVVLDDVWNEGPKKWALLRSAFDVGAHGSKFLVTTRKKEVALVMDSLQPYILEVLSDEISLSLLAQSALGEQNFDDHPSLKLIALGIVKKCDGLPLALISLGRVLKTKGNKEVEWKELLNSDIWNSDNNRDILPALKLSYHDLPSHLKQVFAYCSLFPKDYVFKKKELVLLWMAQGFLFQPKGNNQSMESLGDKYFKELLSRFFFQPLGNDESKYIMHDLMNDLATSVAAEFFFRLDEITDLNGNNEAYEKFRHFSFMRPREAECQKFKELHRARCLRTFLCVHGGLSFVDRWDDITAELLPQLHFLRVLSLTYMPISKVPRSIGNMKHLRYLNFSRTNIHQIPEEVSELYNLQSLLAHTCTRLSNLPVSFAKLINLRHLDMARTRKLKKFPLGIGGLTSLQTLSKVAIQEDTGFKLCELRDLNDLQGELSIEGLENVIDPTEAEDANLHQKKVLDHLELAWGYATTNEDEVIEKLRPHSKLKTLSIKGYGGMKFPSWLGSPSFDQLTELKLYKCGNCTELAMLGYLTSLQKLVVDSCPKLVSIEGEKDLVNVGSSIIMGSLRQLTICHCDSLESYCCPNSVESLEIVGCSSMTSLSFSKLQEEDLPSSSSNLKILDVRSCKNIRSISQEHLQNLTSLEEMWIWNCPSMEDSFPSCGLLWPPNLRKLTIGELKKPMSEWGLQNYPPALVELVLYGKSSGVVSFGIMEEQHDRKSSTCFLLPTLLTELKIWDFEEVESVLEVLEHHPNLQYFKFNNCPKLRDETTSSWS